MKLLYDWWFKQARAVMNVMACSICHEYLLEFSVTCAVNLLTPSEIPETDESIQCSTGYSLA